MDHGTARSRMSLEYDDSDSSYTRRMTFRSAYAFVRGFFARYRFRTPAVLLVFALVILYVYHATLTNRLQERFPLTHLPIDEQGFCQRILVHQFSSTQSIATELLTHIRAAALQSALGYALVLDAHNYILGDISSFWVPPKYPCLLPVDALNTTDAVQLADADLDVDRHVLITDSYIHLHRLDRLARDHGIDLKTMQKLARYEKFYKLVLERVTLPYGETVSFGMENIFIQQAEALARLARPTRDLQKQIDRLSAKLGLGKWFRKRPVVVLQVDSGDKTREQTDVLKAGTHLPLDDVTPFFRAAELALARLYDRDLTPPPRTFPASREGEKALLVVMTEDPNFVSRLQRLDTSAKFQIMLSPGAELSPKEEEEYYKLSGSTQSYTDAVSFDGITRRPIGWESWMTVESSSSLRLALSRHLIVELTVYATRADAFIVRGSTDVGRMAMLLAGEDGVLGHGTQRFVGGRVRSIDVPFFPTSNRSVIFIPN